MSTDSSPSPAAVVGQGKQFADANRHQRQRLKRIPAAHGISLQFWQDLRALEGDVAGRLDGDFSGTLDPDVLASIVIVCRPSSG
jgi:hypothetical protein